jgi:DNA-binding response OmpR family regulator
MARESVLVVDGGDDILELVTYDLATGVLTVVAAASGEDALAATCARQPDAIVLDLMLPRLEVCRRMKSDPAMRHVPTVMHVGELVIDPGRHEVLAGGVPIDTTTSLSRILVVLARRGSRCAPFRRGRGAVCLP